MSLQGTANGNVSSDDGVNNNNNLEINIVKCRISNSAARDATNDLTNANPLLTDNKLEKLIAEIDNINFDEVANSARSQCVPSRRAVAFTQGDYLNEIKMNRKKNSGASNGKSLPIPSNGSIINRPNTRLFAACSSSPPRVVKLDPNKYSVMAR